MNITRTCSDRWLKIIKKLEEGLLVVTASNRQADFLRQQYRYYQIQTYPNRTVWEKPAIITDKQWLTSLFKQQQLHSDASESWTLLSEQESRFIWEEIIEKENDILLDTRRTAERVQQAAKSLEQWLMSDTVENDEQYTWRAETKHFKNWYLTVKNRLKKNHWLEYFELDRWLTIHLESLQLLNSEYLPQKIGFLGFQEYTPARKRLMQSLEQCEIELHHLLPENIESNLQRYEYTDHREEIKQAALWAYKLWHQDPSKRIGIVIPDIQQYRETIRTSFERIFCPAELLKYTNKKQKPFDISLGLQLTAYPLVDHALILADIIGSEITQNEIILLLQSPYFIAKAHEQNISQLLPLIRKSRQPAFNSKELLFYLSKLGAENDINNRFKIITSIDTSLKQSVSQWILDFSSLLENIGWCEQNSLNSEDYQCRQAFYKKFEQLSIYDHLLQPISWKRFKNLLNSMMAEALFQPQTGDCPVQIMGVFEASFLSFDYLRVCGVDNKIWPDNAKPNPFIPYELQKLHDMPNATAERELEVAKKIIQTMNQAAPEVLFSHSKFNGEESLTVSPLIEFVPVNQDTRDNTYFSPAEQINKQNIDIEKLEDDIAPELQQKPIRGGSKLLQDIAKCQFRAFVHHRLKATAPDDPQEGLNPLERGNLVHRILEDCWKNLFHKNQYELQKCINNQRLQSLLKPVIENELQELQQSRHRLLTKAMLRLEFKRLMALLTQWFEMESTRPEFKVKEIEHSVDINLAGSYIHLQLDRVDELQDGKLAIIDYKTGKVDRKNWFGARPDEPQLPLYAVVMSQKNKAVASLLYGQVKNSECRFIGIAEEKDYINGGVKNVHQSFDKDTLNTASLSMDEQIREWHQNLTTLMVEYLSGESAVTPKDEKVCQHCDLHGMCRIGDMSQRIEELSDVS